MKQILNPKYNKVIVVFVEGDTDEIFYNLIIKELYKDTAYTPKSNIKIIVRNIKGVGHYKNKILRIMRNEIKYQYRGCYYYAILCHDTDVFEFQSKPPLDWNKVIRELKKIFCEVELIEAKHSIEDWFLIDIDGVLNFLKLPKDKYKMKFHNGLEEIKRLFKIANKTYLKGKNSGGFIESLDLRKIMAVISKEINVIRSKILEKSS